jgi:hypothetical protein
VSETRAPRSLLFKLILAVVPLLLLVALAELSLWALGLGEGQAPARGFDPGAAYLLRDGDGWRTQIFDDPERDLVIPAKGAARRVVLVGGSNTEIFPDGHLTAQLEALDPDPAHPWEVINLGRSGYGSGRVRILLGQAMALEPDVVVIYSGHNEFVERGLAAELDEALGGAAGRAAASGLGRLRLFRVVEDALRPPRPPPELAPDDPAAREIPWSTTASQWELYRENAAAMCDLATAGGARVVLCTLVVNDFTPPYVNSRAEPREPGAWDAFDVARREGLVLIPRDFREHLRPPLRLRLSSWTLGDGAAADLDLTGLPPLRPLTGPLAQTPATPEEKGGDASLEGLHWPPPEQWNAKVVGVLSAYARLAQRQLVPPMDRNLRQAVVELEEALVMAPDDPDAHYDLGLACWLLGDDVRARQAFTDARRFDRAPHSGNVLSNDALRELAAARPQVTLVDAAARFAEHSHAGLVGYEVMMDSCHLQPGARRVLMDMLAPAIVGK